MSDQPLAAPNRAVPGRASSPPPGSLIEEFQQLGFEAGTYDFRPLDVVRKTIARRMTESFRDVPHFPLLAKVEVDALLAARAEFNERGEETRVTLNDLLVKASALALQASPAANASYTPKGLIFHHHADIAVVVAMDGGLVTPIVRAAETKSVVEIAQELKDLASRGRARRLAPREYSGGTFSISNLGMYGVSSFGSVLNQPQGCILSVGQAEKQFRFDGDTPYPATMLEVTLTCDHRVVDGVVGAKWLQAFKSLVEAPQGWIA